MASVVLALRIAQKKRRSITGGRVVGCLHKDGGHACTERRGRDLSHRADKILIRLSDLACGRRVQIDTCQDVDICSTQLALPSASTLFLFVVVSPYSEEVVLHIRTDARRRVSYSHDSTSRAPAPWRRRTSQSGLYGLMLISLEPQLYRRCPAKCNPGIMHVYLPALMYTAGATASAHVRANARKGRKPFLRSMDLPSRRESRRWYEALALSYTSSRPSALLSSGITMPATTRVQGSRGGGNHAVRCDAPP